MSENETPSGGLGSAFGSKTKGSQISYGHPYAKEILDSATSVIRESETGALFLRLIDQKRVPVHVIKGMGQSGFTPELMTIYLQVPAKAQTANGIIIVNLIKALHESAQELGGLKAPDPSKDIIAYASFIHGRNLDSITETCQVVKELTNTGKYQYLLDSLTELGLNGVYKAYIAGKTRDELYEEYALAYDASTRGSY